MNFAAALAHDTIDATISRTRRKRVLCVKCARMQASCPWHVKGPRRKVLSCMWVVFGVV